MTSPSILSPERVGSRAAQILDAVRDHPDWDRLSSSSMRFSACRVTFTGYPLIRRWDLARDARPLLTEALRVLALKAAVFEVSGGDEAAGDLPAPAPVEEMVHAVHVQFTVMTRMQIDLGVIFPLATGLERFDYDRGCPTDIYYAAAGWGSQPLRYWLDAPEAARRLAILNEHYAGTGFGAAGSGHDLDFDTVSAAG